MRAGGNQVIEGELESGARRQRGLLEVPDFRRLWVVGVVVFAVRWLEMLAVGVFVYQHTGSPFLVALVTLLRMVPMALLGAVLGAVAERVERRTSLVIIILMMLTTSLVLALLAYFGDLAVWHLAVASLINGIAWAADNPVRRVMIGEVVGPTATSKAMSVDIGANNASRMLGPTIGGLLLVSVGIEGAFAVSVAGYLVALAAAPRLRYRHTISTNPTGAGLARMIQGLTLVRGDRRR